ncbi:DUF6443 domain-containing protein [Flavobacterium rhizosphaerae]|uniref:DUF6443 domain-containing protein n=1 Tax=Flavobacterium rhizosphaerae TaxID=3163298 RepID=A0ABW8YZ47_9FLAO
MKKLLYTFLLYPVLLLGQTPTQNYVKTLVYHSESASSNPSKANASVTYYDGLGRPIQQVANKQSGTGKDIITHIEYDAFGRQSRDYLPFVASTEDMTFNSSAQANAVSFYSTSAFQNTTNPYSEKFFDASPINRVMKQSAPGTPWLGNADNDNDHTVKHAYLSNTDEDAVKKLKANAGEPADGVYGTTFINEGYYPGGELYKNIIQDENKNSAIYIGNGGMQNKLNTVEEYTDDEGRLILKRTFFSAVDTFGMSGVGSMDTYYIYDQYGNLSYVLPPKALGSITNADKLSYQYKYDYKNRLVEKKLPGKAWEFIVYDQLDRVVATGPALNPWGVTTGAASGWLFTQYDALGRVAYSGWVPEPLAFTSGRRNTLQSYNYPTAVPSTNATTIDGVTVYYTNPGTTPANIKASLKLLTVNYYDDYRFLNAQTKPTSTTLVEDVNVWLTPKGLATGNWTRALEGYSIANGESTYTFYDSKKARMVRTRTTNYLGGYTQVDNKLEFNGRVQYTKTKHKRTADTNTADTTVTTQEDFTYTSQERLLSHTHTIEGQNPQLLAYNAYNSIGQLISKKVGNNINSPLQIVDYAYNIRGWLTGINNINNLAAANVGNLQPQDLFAFSINYNGTIQQNMNGAITPLYNGSIAETTWRTASDNISRRYGYKYDQVNRLLDAYYQIPASTVPVRNSYNEHLKYDGNGNITSLVRNGGTDSATLVNEIDNLAYTYDGNMLTKVSDSSGNTAGFSDIDQSGAPDYTYDDYANMKTDKNKSITSITYNHLNLPVVVTISGSTPATNNGTISYLYNAAGVKLRKTVTPNVDTAMVTDYLSAYQYENGILEFFPVSEGYVKTTIVSGSCNYNYVFHYKDHLGNNRISYTIDPADNVLKIIEENHYYPFGLKHEGYSANQQIITRGITIPIVIVPVVNTLDATYKYKYNGKELQDELGLNMYDYGARNYDPAIGRWMNIDPLAEVSRRWSPYNYCYDNPIRFVDPDGMQAVYDWEAHDAGRKGVYKDGDKEVSFEEALTSYEGDNTDDNYVFDEKGNYVRTDKTADKFDRIQIENKKTGENRFYSFADPINDPKDISSGLINKIEFISYSQIFSMLYSVDAFDKENGNMFYFASKSRAGHPFDYAYSTLINKFEKAGNSLFLADGDYYAHNFQNFGNYLWAATGYINGFGYAELKMGANIHNYFTRGGYDTDDDQLSIVEGAYYAAKHDLKKFLHK